LDYIPDLKTAIRFPSGPWRVFDLKGRSKGERSLREQDQDATATAEAFARYQESFAAHLRYIQAQRQLAVFFDLGSPLRVLDGAGGNGLNAAFLVASGHEVTVVDANPEMLRKAEERLAPLGRPDRWRLIQGRIEEPIPELARGAPFSVILLHHVLEYLRSPASALAALGRLAVAGAGLSVITLNPVSEVIRAVVFRGDPALAERRLADLSYDARWFGQATLYPMEQIIRWASEGGWHLQEYRGIRVLADYLSAPPPTPEMAQATVSLEEHLEARDPFRSFGRYLHFHFVRQ
jgi:S-adenosylmethionine-dependent methyltransferase